MDTELKRNVREDELTPFSKQYICSYQIKNTRHMIKAKIFLFDKIDWTEDGASLESGNRWSADKNTTSVELFKYGETLQKDEHYTCTYDAEEDTVHLFVRSTSRDVVDGESNAEAVYVGRVQWWSKQLGPRIVWEGRDEWKPSNWNKILIKYSAYILVIFTTAIIANRSWNHYHKQIAAEEKKIWDMRHKEWNHTTAEMKKTLETRHEEEMNAQRVELTTANYKQSQAIARLKCVQDRMADLEKNRIVKEQEHNKLEEDQIVKEQKYEKQRKELELMQQQHTRLLKEEIIAR